MRTRLVCLLLMVLAAGCSDKGKTVTFHAKYSEIDGNINSVLFEHFDVCREDGDNRIRLIIDDIPPGDTIPRGGDQSTPIEATSTWKCSEMLED